MLVPLCTEPCRLFKLWQPRNYVLYLGFSLLEFIYHKLYNFFQQIQKKVSDEQKSENWSSTCLSLLKYTYNYTITHGKIIHIRKIIITMFPRRNCKYQIRRNCSEEIINITAVKVKSKNAYCIKPVHVPKSLLTFNELVCFLFRTWSSFSRSITLMASCFASSVLTLSCLVILSSCNEKNLIIKCQFWWWEKVNVGHWAFVSQTYEQFHGPGGATCLTAPDRPGAHNFVPPAHKCLETFNITSFFHHKI